jgi:hypothetical protein
MSGRELSFPGKSGTISSSDLGVGLVRQPRLGRVHGQTQLHDRRLGGRPALAAVGGEFFNTLSFSAQTMI